MRTAAVLIICMLVISGWGCSSLPRQYVSLDSASELPLEEMMKRLEGSRVVFVGEIHGDRPSHRVQLEVMRHLNATGKKVVVATEMFPPDKQSVLDAWIKGDVRREDLKKEFESSVNMPYRYYEHIFELARGKKIPIIAINAEAALISEVSQKGTASVPAELLDKYRFAGCSTAPSYAALLVFVNDDGYHQDDHAYLCDAQRLRDTVMAYNIAALLEENEKTVVVFTGLVHAAKPAVPKIVQGYMPVTATVVLPGTSEDLFSDGVDAETADYIWR
jgi:uncharacterized iron-regulated protein